MPLCSQRPPAFSQPFAIDRLRGKRLVKYVLNVDRVVLARNGFPGCFSSEAGGMPFLLTLGWTKKFGKDTHWKVGIIRVCNVPAHDPSPNRLLS